MRARTIGFSALALSALFLPFITFAADANSLINMAIAILNNVIVLFIILALVIFFWGLIQYILKLGGEDGGKGGLKLMLWGIVALFVMVSIWGLVRLLQNTVGVNSNEAALRPSTFQPSNIISY